MVEAVGKWPVAILIRQWIHHTEFQLRKYHLNWIQLCGTGVIACNSLLIHIPGKLLGRTLHDCPFVKLSVIRWWLFSKRCFWSANFGKWKLSNSKSTQEYAKLRLILCLTIFEKKRALPEQFSLFWTKFVGKLLMGNHFLPMKKSDHHGKISLLCSIANRHFTDLPVTQGWGLLSQFPSFRYFPNFSVSSKHTLAIECRVYIWQVSPQLSCGGTCQI